MIKENKIKTGDKIVHFGRVYRVFKINKSKGVIFFRPYFKNNKNKGLVYSIPLENMDKTRIRKPLSKNKISILLRKIAAQKKVKKFRNANKMREILNQNDPVKTLNILKALFKEKKKKDNHFTPSKQALWKLALTKIQEEMAFVWGTSLKEAQKKIKSVLERAEKSG